MWSAFAILAAILWGLNYTLTERLLQNVAPITLLAFEMLVGAIGFFSVAYLTHLKQDIATLATHSSLLFIFIIEIIVVLLANLFIVFSIQAKDATVAGFVELLYPLFTIIFTWLIFRENHLNMAVMLGAGLIMIGVSIIYWGTI